MADKILTLHHEGKKGANIDLEKYNTIKKILLDIIHSNGEITYQNLNKKAVIQLQGNFKGSIPWYVVTVKLDLEARGIIERLPGTSPQVIRIKN